MGRLLLIRRTCSVACSTGEARHWAKIKFNVGSGLKAGALEVAMRNAI